MEVITELSVRNVSKSEKYPAAAKSTLKLLFPTLSGDSTYVFLWFSCLFGKVLIRIGP